ncbi:hypothetical protein GCM10025762_32510 [Haloechinothrix salitolerans]
MRFIETHKDAVGLESQLRWGVEPICRVLSEHGIPIAPSTYYEARKRGPSRRQQTDEQLIPEITRVHAQNYGVYGARKVWLMLNREGITVARCTVERLMHDLGLEGARRGRRTPRTTVSDQSAQRAADLLRRDFTAAAPNTRWVADFTYVATHGGTVYVAFVVDVFSRKIIGWQASTRMRTSLVLDALEMALWHRECHGQLGDGLILHSDAGSQYTSIAFTNRLADAGARPSVGSVGDALDNALAETTIGLYKTELIDNHGPWRGLSQVELATLEYVDWYNHRRLHGACDDLTPAETEEAYHQRHATLNPETAPTH